MLVDVAGDLDTDFVLSAQACY